MMQLLEIALVDELDKAPDTLPPCSLIVWWNCYHLLPVVLVVMSLITTLNVVLKVIVLVVRFDFFCDVASLPTGTDDYTFYVSEKVSIAQGVKLRPKVERSYSSCAKATCSSELENVVFHEDKAHFGDLFCESGRGLQKDMISHQLLLTLAPARTRNIDRLCLSWDDIGSTMSSILGFWKAKHAAVVEDLAAKSVWKELCKVFDLWVLLLIF
ncbi:PREDICTED: auxin transport [Prunus dulcis]|uniref:PREDICTED: auxin transport n=1 Tax=Prunus dulcis TaxID=3755 RepID=A0A5E4FQG5_PRUDU|nr:PREDICTED: auxin transport [Prunus dulcis]